VSPLIGRFPDPNDLDRLLFEEMRGVGQDAELAFAAHARHATGRMARNVKSHVVGRNVEVTVFARDPTSGYDYVGVTRFGHVAEFIYPKADRRPASVLATGRLRQRGHRAMLRFIIGGRVFYRSRVKAFHPDHDWAEDAMPEVQDSADRAMVRIGQRIHLQ
jgi:hypothetical protein